MRTQGLSFPRRRESPWLGLLAIPGAFALLYLFPYLPWHGVSICAVRHMLHVDCPGCGMTRAVSAFLHGKFLESWNYHPLGIVVALGLAYLWFKAVYGSLLRKDLPLLGGFELASARVFLAALFATWFVRVII